VSNPNEDTSTDTTGYNKRLMDNVVRLPVAINAASGSSLMDHEGGGVLLDFWGDEGVQSLGYGPVVNQALCDFAFTGLPHQLPDVYPNQCRWDAAELICDRTGMDRAFFCNSGTEANEAMIKLARKYWWDLEVGSGALSPEGVARRHVILTVGGNFHGRTGLSLAASDPRVSPYHRHGFGPIAQGFGVIDWDGDFVWSVKDGRSIRPRRPDWSTVAAVTLAPVLGNNCVETYPRAFWDRLGELREQHEFLLMFDDVQAGAGRAGHYATWQHPDIRLKPDIMALGKGIALGFPMAVMLADNYVAGAFTPGVHFNTFGGSPFCCYMAQRYYRWLDRNLGRVRVVGERIRDKLDAKPWIAHVDGAGLLNAFTPDWALGFDGFQFCHEARRHGLSIVTHRSHGPIRFTPPMNISDNDLDRAFKALDATAGALR